MAEVGSSPLPHGPGELLLFGSLVTQTTVPTIGRCSVNFGSKSALNSGRETSARGGADPPPWPRGPRRLGRLRGDDDIEEPGRLFLPASVTPPPPAVTRPP